MTEEMKYYTGNCITDLHTDTSFSYCNKEKCKQYKKSDGLNFCMSSGCPEKDCIYALTNKLHQKIGGLEQENKELKEWKDKVVKLFESACRCKYLNEEIDICSYTNEKCININKCAYKYQELSDNYRSALEEIRGLAQSITDEFEEMNFEQQKHYCDEISNNIVNKIDEVLND